MRLLAEAFTTLVRIKANKRLQPASTLMGALPCSAVLSRGVRPVWMTVLVGLLGLGVGFTIGLLLRPINRPINANAIEAAGTWFVGLVGVAALVGGPAECRAAMEALNLYPLTKRYLLFHSNV